jgi:hypothetical protein
MRNTRYLLLAGAVLVLGTFLVAVGCSNTPIDVSDQARGPAPLRLPASGKGDQTCDCYEDSLTGGQVFTMYCAYCHNAPTLAERPFSQYQNVAAHMRVRANLTGKEYAKLMEFLRRWHDVPPPEEHAVPSPKRFFFSQPIPELRDQRPKAGQELPGGPRPGATNEATSGQPPPGNAPQEAR